MTLRTGWGGGSPGPYALRSSERVARRGEATSVARPETAGPPRRGLRENDRQAVSGNQPLPITRIWPDRIGSARSSSSDPRHSRESGYPLRSGLPPPVVGSVEALPPTIGLQGAGSAPAACRTSRWNSRSRVLERRRLNRKVNSSARNWPDKVREHQPTSWNPRHSWGGQTTVSGEPLGSPSRGGRADSRLSRNAGPVVPALQGASWHPCLAKRQGRNAIGPLVAGNHGKNEVDTGSAGCHNR